MPGELVRTDAGACAEEETMSAMLRSLPFQGLIFPAFAISLLATSSPAGEQQPPDASLGRKIFEHNWARPETWADPENLGDGGDGLGPVFNATSCTECHGLMGPGGAGRNSENAVLLSIVADAPAARHTQLGVLNRARGVHFGFAESTTVVLHKFGLGPVEDPHRFDVWRSGLLAPADESLRTGGVKPVRFETANVEFELAQRNTPALWGLAAVEWLREHRGGLARIRFAKEQRRKHSWITGRIPRTDGGAEAWYGWRGQTATLHDFVLNACTHELGLAVPGRMQPASPAESARDRLQASQQKRKLDLTDHQCRSLTEFVRSLPRPQQQLPEGREELAMVQAGEAVFDRIGCTACHPPELGGVDGLYSDLLLHDMGTSLSDHSTAQPEIEPGQFIRTGGNGYSGGRVVDRIPPRTLPCDCDLEWRTPPLWGVANSAPYLHDGRAATLEEAILQHGGEAAPAAHAFEILNENERWNLLAFLETLRAPPIP
jgi:CxxC motif-containing protein (DUF1111 family)